MSAQINNRLMIIYLHVCFASLYTMLSLMSIKTKKSTGQDVGPNGQTDFPYSFHTAFIHCNVVMVFNSDQLISKGYQCYALCKINQV